MGEAIRLWEDAAKGGHLYAFIELAKFYEHKEKDIQSALKWTASALEHLKKIDMPAYMQNHWTKEIKHRMKRLNRKAGL